MTPTFAQFQRLLQACALASVLVLTACATRLPPPTTEVATAQQSVTRAAAADADQYAFDELEQARTLLGQAQAALSAGRDDEARGAALSSAALADLALARSREAAAQSELAQHRAQITDLRRRIGMEGE
ncbi:DUF4398 domain-containing protein [Luteimonas abyssi]|jgi:hypothetical protein|uniref:DUF4398 domain-containing protein n=1 Tax=Luteimonas abyssi TaxID=1247514 RepID=UPI000737B989|nr:DUF4398 domain-containing protein [Luteimonas abyssi]